MTKQQKTAIEIVFLYSICTGVYLASANPHPSGDSIPNTIFGFNILENCRLDFDNFRGSYLDTPSSYWFIKSASGHLNSTYPLGTSIIAFPVTICYWLYLKCTNAGLALTSVSFDANRILFERIAAASIVSIGALIFYFTSRMRFSKRTSLITVFIYAFATSNWAISSQQLWQHGSSNLCILAVVFCVFRANRNTNSMRCAMWLLIAGLACGLLPVIRPSNIIFSMATTFFCLFFYTRFALWFLLGNVSTIPGVLYNLYYFHNLLGGYKSFFTPEIFSPILFPTSFTGSLFSPGRGLFFYCPVLFFSLAGLWKLFKNSNKFQKDQYLISFLSMASAAYCMIFFCYRDWWGGACYGPRLMTEAVPMLVFLINYYLETALSPSTFIRQASCGVFYFVTALSTFIQMIGVFGVGGELWNPIPLNVNNYPERLWSLHDSPIARHLNAFGKRSMMRNINKLIGNDIDNQKSDGTLRGTVLSVLPEPFNKNGGGLVEPGMTKAMMIEVENLGATKWNGYESGNGALETVLYVQVEFLDKNNKSAANCSGKLYVAGSPSSGEKTFAEGEVVFPSEAGDYTMLSRLHWYYIPESTNVTTALRSPVKVFRHNPTVPHKTF